MERVLATGVGESRLVVDWVSREDTGLYICQASNTVSLAPPISTAIVITREHVYAVEESFAPYLSSFLDYVFCFIQ